VAKGLRAEASGSQSGFKPKTLPFAALLGQAVQTCGAFVSFFGKWEKKQPSSHRTSVRSKWGNIDLGRSTVWASRAPGISAVIMSGYNTEETILSLF
jgi:hypothetical protein